MSRGVLNKIANEVINMSTKELQIRDALREAMEEEMIRDESVFLVGEEVGAYDGAYKCSRGMLQKFGPKRVIDAPIAECGFAGLGIGAAMAGLRPIVEFMTFNFSLVAIDQIINTAAKALYMSAGQIKTPIVFRGAGGITYQLGAQHTNSFESFYAYTPGLIVVAPATPKDMKGLLKSSIRDDNPVIFIESELTYGTKGEVPEEEYLIPIGKADVKKQGSDITLLTWSKSYYLTMDIATALEEEGISAEVVDLRTLRPLDTETVLNSVAKTHRVAIIQEQHTVASYGAYLSHMICNQIFDELDAPPVLCATYESPMPYSKALEMHIMPTKERCLQEIRKIF